ncbi:MAG: hypothetical protein Q8S20_20375 [Sulfuritalea sp.]|nr:hypothetical protein [Sulfuritalea sp.]
MTGSFNYSVQNSAQYNIAMATKNPVGKSSSGKFLKFMPQMGGTKSVPPCRQFPLCMMEKIAAMA